MIGWLRRRSGPVLIAGIACAALAYAIAAFLPDRHTAEAVVVVPSGGTSGLTPGEASNLATTYANLIPEDRAILERTAARLRLDPVAVRQNLLVTHDFDTSILRLSFSDPDPEVAINGSRFLAQSLAGRNPVSPRIAPRSLSIVAVPTGTTTQSLEPFQALVLGLLLGLIGGSLVMIAWERADPRIRDVKTLGTEVGCASSSLQHASDESVVALLNRWTDIGGKTPLRVALLAATPLAEHGSERASDRLLKLVTRSHRQVVSIGEPGTQTDPQVHIDVGGAVGGAAAGERLARNADFIVLVVAEGTPVEELRHALDVLDQFGARPDWALFVDSVDKPTPQPSTTLAPPPEPATAVASERSLGRWTPISTTSAADTRAKRAGGE
jgi:capsular polysaccharide biosynthesis protein